MSTGHKTGSRALSGNNACLPALLITFGIHIPNFFPKSTHSYNYLKWQTKKKGWAHAFNRSTWEAEAGWSLWVWGQPGLHSEFQDSQSYLGDPVLINKTKQKKITTTKDIRRYASFAHFLTTGGSLWVNLEQGVSGQPELCSEILSWKKKAEQQQQKTSERYGSFAQPLNNNTHGIATAFVVRLFVCWCWW